MRKKEGAAFPPPGIRPLSVIVFLNVPFLRNGNRPMCSCETNAISHII